MGVFEIVPITLAREIQSTSRATRLQALHCRDNLFKRVLMGVPTCSYELTTNFSANCQLTTISLANCQLTTNFS